MAVTTPMVTGNFAKEVDPGVRKFYVEEYQQVDPMVEKYFQVAKQIDLNQEEQLVAGFGIAPVVTEASNYPKDSMLQSYTTIYTPDKYGFDFEVSDELVRYDKSGAFSRATTGSKAAARAIANRVGTQAGSVYNNGFNTSFTSFGDTKPLFSTSHVPADGGTSQSNASASSIALTDANLETAMVAFRQQLDDRGKPFVSNPDTLVVPFALQKTATIITGSDKRSGTADNDMNVYASAEYTGGTLRVVAWRYLSPDLGGSNTAWFLLDSRTHKVEFKWGVKPEVFNRYDFKLSPNDTYAWRARTEFSTGWSDFRGTYGSKGDGSAYSS